ncbi:MAG: SMP-30/gluconolactonase/LRE family protein [Planctomycetaceae bacterium]
MRSVSTLLLATLIPALAWAQELPSPSGSTIVPPGAKLEKLFTRSAPIRGGLTEGPTPGPDGAIYFSDIPVGDDRGMIMRFDPATKQTTTFIENSQKSNGLKFGADGMLYACEGSDQGGRAVVRWNPQTKQRTVLADKYMGKRFNAPNDLVLDRAGRIYFSDPRYLGTEPRELEHRSVYRVDPDGRVTEITHEVEKPNGIALSPDQRTLYLADHNNGTDRIDPDNKADIKKGAMKIYAFPLGPDGLVSGPRRTLVDFGDQAGCDGMTVDSKGHIYLTARGVKRPGVLVIDPTGKEVAFIPTGPPNQSEEPPVGLPSNVTFGIGDQKQTLYITVDTSLYRIGLLVPGFHSGVK